MAGVLAEVNDDLERAVRSLTVELADLKATLAEVRLVSRPTARRRSSCPSCRCDLARCSDAVPVAEEDRMMRRMLFAIAVARRGRKGAR
jgi:hypothetical protein